MSELAGLLEQVEAAGSEDHSEIFDLLTRQLLPHNWWTSDIGHRLARYIQAEAWTDAALTLVEVKLPGAYGALQFGALDEGRCEATILLDVVTELPTHQETRSLSGSGNAPTLRLAIVTALLSALLQQGEGK